MVLILTISSAGSWRIPAIFPTRCALPRCQGLAESGVTRFYLAHLSKDNNTPEVAYITSQAALTEAGMKEGQDYVLRVAPRYDTEPVLKF